MLNGHPSRVPVFFGYCPADAHEMKDLRVGVIGCGQVALTSHLHLLARMPGVRVSGLADTDAHALRTGMRLAPAAEAFGDSRTLIESGIADAVVIALPTHLHADAAVAAFDAGLHVYLEKPIAADIDDALSIVNAWNASKAVGMIGFNFRFNPLVQKLKDLVASGKIGNVTSAQTRFVTPAPGSTSWRATRSTGGGALLDLAVHHIDLIRFVLDDEIETVTARIQSRRSDEDFAELTIRTRHGTAVRIDAAFGESFDDHVEVHGTHGILWTDRGTALDVGFSRAAGSPTLLSRARAAFPTPSRILFFASSRRAPYHDISFNLALRSFVSAASSSRAIHPDLIDGVAALQVVAAARESSAGGNAVTVGDAVHGDAIRRN